MIIEMLLSIAALFVKAVVFVFPTLPSLPANFSIWSDYVIFNIIEPSVRVLSVLINPSFLRFIFVAMISIMILEQIVGIAMWTYRKIPVIGGN